MSDENVKSGFQFKKVRSVTLEMLKPKIDEEFYVKFSSAMRVSDVKPKEGDEPATVAEVINLESGEENILIVSAVVKSALLDGYKDDSYVGKSFAITKKARVGSAKFNPFTVIEIVVAQ